MSIGLGLLLVAIEALWLKTKNPFYHQLARFWSKVFALTFALIGLPVVLACSVSQSSGGNSLALKIRIPTSQPMMPHAKIAEVATATPGR